MKKVTILSTIILAFLVLFVVTSCKKDPISVPSTPPLGLENIDWPGVMMTLSAISYIDGDSIPSVIKDSIEILLKDSTLATGGNWQLVWGPGISAYKANMVFVAMTKAQTTPVYAIVIRGTNMASIPDIVQDLDVFTRVQFTYGEPGDSVSQGAMQGLHNLLFTTDGTTSKTLESFLQSLPSGQAIPLFVTGHSQGGGLAPLMAYWLLRNNSLTDKFIFHTIAFAGPGVINQNFVANFNKALPSTGSFQMKINSNDVIPWLWASLPGIIQKGVPVHVPLPHRIFLQSAQDTLQTRGIAYVNLVKADSIGAIPITNSAPGGIMPADSIKWYDHWLAVEHNHNNYLKLLGVKQLPGN